MNTIRMLAAAAALLVSSAAMADVVFDPATGNGFVGKGDVQLAFGWNNAQLQSNASAVTFTYALQATYNVTCEWDSYNSGRNRQTINHKVTDGLVLGSKATFASSSRTNRQGVVTGFILAGYSSATPSGAAPLVGDADFCNDHDMGPDYNPNTDSHTGAVVTAVSLVAGSEQGGLFVNYGDASVPLAY